MGNFHLVPHLEECSPELVLLCWTLLNYCFLRTWKHIKLGVPNIPKFCCFVGLNFEPVLGRYRLLSYTNKYWHQITHWACFHTNLLSNGVRSLSPPSLAHNPHTHTHIYTWYWDSYWILVLPQVPTMHVLVQIGMTSCPYQAGTGMTLVLV